jgi:hypothetical protein
MAHNVPAVCDGLSARIRALRSKDQGWQNVPEQWRGNEAKRNDLAIAEAEPLLRRSVNRPVMRRVIFLVMPLRERNPLFSRYLCLLIKYLFFFFFFYDWYPITAKFIYFITCSVYPNKILYRSLNCRQPIGEKLSPDPFHQNTHYVNDGQYRYFYPLRLPVSIKLQCSIIIKSGRLRQSLHIL